MTITEIALLMLFALAWTGFIYCWLMWRKALDGWGRALDAWGDAIERNKAYIALLRQEPTPITGLEAQVARLRAFAEEMSWYAPEEDWEDAAHRLLHPGDVHSIAGIRAAIRQHQRADQST